MVLPGGGRQIADMKILDADVNVLAQSSILS